MTIDELELREQMRRELEAQFGPKSDPKSKLSGLQKELLLRGLKSHWRAEINPGRDFALRQHGHNNGVWARAAKRLMQRGLFERVSHGQWRLTELGLEVASQLSSLLSAAELARIEAVVPRLRPRRGVRRTRPGPKLSKAEADAQFRAALGL